jgi:hypothetical protein
VEGALLVSPIASEDQWQMATPESVGIAGGKLSALAVRFEEWKEANLHGVVVYGTASSPLSTTSGALT